MKPTKQQKQSNISGKNKRQKLIFDSNRLVQTKDFL
jgi:hypothetical protein